MRWLGMLLIWIWPGLGLAQALPEALAKRIGADPAGYLEDVAALIAGYGTGGGIDRAGLDNVVALARASARASALRRLQGADLDGDGAVTAAEFAVVSAAAAAVQRGRLAVYLAQADGDGDGAVSAAELRAYGGAAALAAYDEARAGQLRAVLGFDGNGDGVVTLGEVRAGVAALPVQAPPKPAKS